MLYGIAAVLVILWALGFVAFHVAGAIIHVLLAIAAVLIAYSLITGRRGA